jgi:hypothetical protein
MRRLGCLLGVIAVAGLAAQAADAKLTPVEQKWAKPVISVWNEQNLALHVVLQAASAKNALVYGSTNNKKLTTILNTFIVCTSLIKKAGKPPSPRIDAFLTPLTSACTHDTKGANDFAKAVGEVLKHNEALVNQDLSSGVDEFKLGTASLSKAYKALIAIGGTDIFKA